MQSERTTIILEELNKQGFVRVKDLSEKLNCTEVTIRSDIKKLEKQGLLKRTHGGAVKQEIEFAMERLNSDIYKNARKKEIISRRAYGFIQDGDTIIIDEATTTLFLTKFIKEDSSKHIVVVTNSLLVAMELKNVAHVQLFMVGGQVEEVFSASLGDMTVNNITNFYVDKAFIGAKGINFDVGLTSIAYPQMQVKKAIISVTKELYVLADGSKFGSAYLSVVCPISDITRIITDQSIPPGHKERAEKMGIDLIVVK